MPRYDYSCPKCEKEQEYTLHVAEVRDTLPRYCPYCRVIVDFGLLVRAPIVHDWGNAGDGRLVEDFAPQGMRFRDKRSYEDHMKRNGLREWRPKQGEPGCEV